MRNFLLVLTLLIFCNIVFSQERTRHEPKNREHVVVSVPTKMMPGKTFVAFDFGYDARKVRETKLVNENGDKIQFNTLADVLNYMSNENWELDQHTVNTSGMATVHFLIMSRPIVAEGEEEEEK